METNRYFFVPGSNTKSVFCTQLYEHLIVTPHSHKTASHQLVILILAQQCAEACQAVLQAQLCVRTGRVEKLRRRLLTKNRAGAALPGSSSEVIDLQDSSREATPELNSGMDWHP